jgi:D-lactate dehydrogenase (cytochrome)
MMIFSVPVSRLPELVHETKKDLLESNLRSTIVGHVGDGNFHALILFDGEQELAAVSDAVHRLVHRAIKLDGTCQLYTPFCIVETYQKSLFMIGTGEHGVGVGKKEYLVEELGVNTVELMRTIKRAIDPLNIMNPGKVSRCFRTLIALIEIAQALSR